MKKVPLTIALSTVIVLVAIVGLVAVYPQKPVIQNPDKRISDNTSVTPTVITGVIENVGTVVGSISYPSESIPEGLTVCAENASTKRPYCTSEQVKDSKFTYGVGYKLSLPEGVYTIYATVPENETKAYYSEYVTCGLRSECTSHLPIEINVKAGSILNSIDPQDWYAM